MKKLLIALIIIIIVVAGGYKFGIKYASDALISQIANEVLSQEEIDKLIEDPEVQRTIEEQLGPEALQNLRKEHPDTAGEPGAGINNPAQTNTGTQPEKGSPESSPQRKTDTKLVFSTKEEALEFVLTKFSNSEIKGFIDMAEGGITAQEKEQIKAALMERLTPEEYQALKVIGLIELQKRPDLVKYK